MAQSKDWRVFIAAHTPDFKYYRDKNGAFDLLNQTPLRSSFEIEKSQSNDCKEVSAPLTVLRWDHPF